MSMKIEKLSDEPIIVVTFDGQIDTAAMIAMFADTIALMPDDGSPVYRIVDYYAVTTPFDEVLRAAREATANHPSGSTTDPRILPVMVGGEEWLGEARRAFAGRPFGSVEIPMFSSITDAVMTIRQQITTKD
jgi:hypothetical protein